MSFDQAMTQGNDFIVKYEPLTVTFSTKIIWNGNVWTENKIFQRHANYS